MKCPFCGKCESKVVDKRDTGAEGIIRRRRECLSCSKRYTTYERLESTPITVVKKDNTRTQFDRCKLMAGLMKACEKRPVPRDDIDKVADFVESELKSADDTEIPSKKIGEIVMKRLKRLDKIAYIRFASVYKDFKDIEEFNNELQKLIKK
ncbi:transcriptional regulator NrdR [Nanoarchaeota archaeon]